VWQGCGLALVLASCGFRHGQALADGPADVPDAAVHDAPAPDAAGLCGGKVWQTDFSTDPTQLDGNGDGTNDWMLRDGSPFPTSQLVAGVWQTPNASQPLDTQPKQPFLTRTIIHVRMRNTTTSGSKGAVFWINVGYDGSGTFAPLFVDVKLQSNNTQSALVMRKTSAGVEQNVATLPGLGTDFVDVDLDIDPTTLMFTYAIAGSTGTATLNRQTGSTATDEWATAVAFSVASEFDSVRVEVCP